MLSLAKIFEDYDNKYTDDLQKYGQSIIKNVYDRFDKQNKAMEKNLKLGNQLEVKDIEEL